MDPTILDQLRAVTPEERAILEGRTTIDRALYMEREGTVINSRRLLAAGKLITIRPHTRFIRFPEHTHDYVEAVYMCAGETTHIVDGETLHLAQGELLFMNQHARHQVLRAEEQDIAVNFIVLPDFFLTSLAALGEEETPLRRFLVDCLCGQDRGPGYLLFRVAQVEPVQNLVENLLFALLRETGHRQKISQMTMALLFLQLLDHTEKLTFRDREEAAVLKALKYVETRYADGSLADAARRLHYDPVWLSREIKRKTGKTYTQLVQEKRLAQAAFLLWETDRRVSDVSLAVGYENISYFHRLFAAAYGRSPKSYRDGGAAPAS